MNFVQQKTSTSQQHQNSKLVVQHLVLYISTLLSQEVTWMEVFIYSMTRSPQSATGFTLCIVSELSISHFSGDWLIPEIGQENEVIVTRVWKLLLKVLHCYHLLSISHEHIIGLKNHYRQLTAGYLVINTSSSNPILNFFTWHFNFISKLWFQFHFGKFCCFTSINRTVWTQMQFFEYNPRIRCQ